MTDARTPFQPQPIDLLRARYAAAIRPLIVAQRVMEGREPPPGSKPEHVFDFEDGLKLIVSRELLPSGNVVVHFSASFVEGTAAAVTAPAGVGPFLVHAVESWQRLANTTQEPAVCFITPGKRIPHWHVTWSH